jgi:YggT family protein
MLVIAPALQIVGVLFLAALLIRSVFSWIEPYPRNRVHLLAYRITEPVIAPVRRLIPPIGGFDVAFMVVFVAVIFLLQLVSSSPR